MPKTKQCEGAAALTMLGESSFYAVQLAREKKKGRSPKDIKAVAAKVQDCFIACKNESFLDWEKSSVEVIDNSRNVTFKKDTVQNIFGEVSAPIQLKFENTNYSVFDCTVPCQNCTSIVSPLKNEIECLKADLARRDAIIDGLLKKETPVKIKIPNYETQRREERKKACRSVGGLSRALFIGRLMHMLPFPSSLDMKNCFEATFEFLKSRNIVHASLLNDQETQKEILNFIGIEKGGLAGSSLKEIGEILIGGIDNISTGYNWNIMLTIVGRKRSNIIDEFISKIEGFIYIPLTLEVEGKTSIDLENNFMYFYVEDITSTSFWIKERMEYLLKGIKDSITHITPTVLSHYSNEEYMKFMIYAVSRRLLQEPVTQIDWDLFRSKFSFEIDRLLDDCNYEVETSLDIQTHSNNVYRNCLENAKFILQVPTILTTKPTWMSIFRGNIVQKLKCIVKNRFRKEVLSEAYLPDIKYGGEWLSLGVMTLSLLERHGRLKYLGDVILNWMISLSSHFQKFPCLEKLYALWACSASSSFMKSHNISQQEKDCFLKEFKERGTGLLKKKSTCSNSSKYTAKVGSFHECGVDLVNGFFCRSVKIVDGGTLKSASELVRGFSSKFVDDDEFADTLRSHLDDILKLKDRDRVNGFWTLLFYVTHVILIQTEYMTMVTTVGSSQLRNFISDFCIIAGQNEVIQMADSLSEILLCVDMCEKNKYAIYKMTEALLKMVTSSGDLQQNDDALGEREDLHSKLTTCAALINVLIFIDSEVSEMAVEKALKPKKGK